MKSVVLIISGSIAAVKSPELIRQLRAKNIDVRCIMTKSSEKFVSVSEIEKLSGHKVSTDLFAEDEMRDMWHIRFSREADLIVVAPASANLIAKMANGIADDMATATLLANNQKLLVAPAMNTYMWLHPATQRNVAQIIADGAEIIEPRVGMLACGEVGAGRMAEPVDIMHIIEQRLATKDRLRGMRALVTAGPTYEAIDPVRFIGNRSSGKQGYTIAAELARQGASVTLVTGPTSLPLPSGVKTMHVTSAADMLKACEKTLPVDVAVCVAAVSDWRVAAPAKQKIKKGKAKPKLALVENPDILQLLSQSKKRPKLVIGFAAETENLLKNATAKLKKKGCDWILANDVSKGKGFDADDNQVTLVTGQGSEKWPKMSKDKVAEKLIEQISKQFRKKAA
jgi:phosphopantothenoylcysteine decarboxylase/phosphopantothenate--cysteine ligase